MMKKMVCMIGPFPPPVNGNSKALETIIRSEQCNQIFDFLKIDLHRLYSGENGRISWSKIKGIFRLRKAVREIRKKECVDTYYISSAQTRIGCIRDIIIIREIVKQIKDKRIIIHLHGGGFKRYYSNEVALMRFYIKKYYSKVDAAIVLCNSLIGLFDGVIPPHKVLVIPNCIENDLLLSSEEFEEKLASRRTSETTNILYLSNMIESKGYKDLLEAAIKYQDHLNNCQYYFAGEFRNRSDRDWFERRINETPAGSFVHYVGTVAGKEKRELLRECDVLVLPTYYLNEGLPISIIEGMSSGMAIVATNHAGICDLVADGENGLFIMPKSPRSIGESLIRINTREKIEKMARNGRRLALEKFTEEKYITRICSALGEELKID